jgi:hypothetical protein
MLSAAISASLTLTPFSYVLASSSQRTVRPFLVVVAAINSTTADRLVSGRPRQFCVMWQNRRCSILFHCVLRKHVRKGVMPRNHMEAD